MMSLLVVLCAILAGSIAVAVGALDALRVRFRRPAVSRTKPDYALIQQLEDEDDRWRRRQQVQAHTADTEALHLELDSLWRQYFKDPDLALRRRINELSEDYGQATEDQMREEAS